MASVNHGGNRPNSGRKKTLPADAKNRSIVLTDKEYEQVKEYVNALRRPN